MHKSKEFAMLGIAEQLLLVGCLSADTFYVRAIPPTRAQLYFAQLTDLGAR